MATSALCNNTSSTSWGSSRSCRHALLSG
jgi:hypothetical protein